jgi:ribosome-associated translation inhibitor RaiA
MAVNIHNLIAAIVPNVYCVPSLRKEVYKIRNKEGILKAAELAIPVESQFIDIEEEHFMNNPFLLKHIKNPIEKHQIIYDNFSQALEPLYYWLLDYIGQEYKEPSVKLIDNFTTATGSAQFGETGAKTTRMQEEAMKMLQTSGVLIKSILQIIYDLKEFKIRLEQYDDLHSSDPTKKSAALLALKQIWLDQVDFAKRGTTSLKQMAAQFDYVTIIDAFFATNSLQDVKNLDLNDRVKRILEQRVSEFEKWIQESERELRKRFEIEKIYLKNQVNSVQLYARWIKPYLLAAKQLEQPEMDSADLINSFNSTILNLSIIAVRKYVIDEDIGQDNLPKIFKKYDVKDFKAICVVELKYRSAPERTNQGGYGFRGRVEVTFTSYALTKNELKLVKELVDKDSFGDLMSMIQGSTTESLAQIKDDLDEFLDTDKKEKKEESDDVNPFSSLFSFFKTSKSKYGEVPGQDSDQELVLRNQAILRARKECDKMYGNFKGTLNMPKL